MQWNHLVGGGVVVLIEASEQSSVTWEGVLPSSQELSKYMMSKGGLSIVIACSPGLYHFGLLAPSL